MGAALIWKVNLGAELQEIIEDWVAQNTVAHRFSLTDATENMMLLSRYAFRFIVKMEWLEIQEALQMICANISIRKPILPAK